MGTIRIVSHPICFVARPYASPRSLPLGCDISTRKSVADSRSSTIWSPLEQGILTGKYNDGLPEGSRFAVNVQGASSEKAKFLSSDAGKAQLQKVRELTKLAEELGTNMSNLALAWAISNKNVSTCIVSPSLYTPLSIQSFLIVPQPYIIHLRH